MSDPADPLFLGIDVGTQSVKAVLVDRAGRLVGQGSHPLTSTRVDERHEQDPDHWWAALCAATRAALHDVAGLERRLAGVAIDATSGTVLVQDSDLRPLTPGLMYDDGRARELLPRTEPGAAIWAAFGVRMQGGWALPKVLWLLDEGLVPSGARIVHQGDHLGARLVGRAVATDSSQALKTGADLLTLRWPAAFDELGIDAAMLPEIVLPGTVLGQVSLTSAALTGIPAGTPLKAGLTDGCAGQIAGGVLHPGSWSSSLGTTLILKGSSPAPVLDPTGAVYGHRSPDGGWWPGGASSVGAGLISRDFLDHNLDELTSGAASFEGMAGYCYPLAGRGERFPFVAPQATGFEVDLPDDTAGRFAAVLQGIAFTEKLAYDRLHELGAPVTGPIAFAGGTARNEYWNQLRCDLLDVPCLVAESAEPATGSAVLAAAPAGRLAATTTEMIRVDRRYEPDPERAARLLPTYDRFRLALADRGWIAS